MPIIYTSIKHQQLIYTKFDKTDELPDANSVMLSRDDFPLPELVQRCKVLLVHHLLVDAPAGAQLVGGLEP